MWNKLSLQDISQMYTSTLENNLDNIQEGLTSLENHTINDIDKGIECVITDLMTAIHNAARNLPVKTFKKHLKPGTKNYQN